LDRRPSEPHGVLKKAQAACLLFRHNLTASHQKTGGGSHLKNTISKNIP
jgi:hypothetical protein